MHATYDLPIKMAEPSIDDQQTTNKQKMLSTFNLSRSVDNRLRRNVTIALFKRFYGNRFITE